MPSMDVELARWLVSAEAEPALAVADEFVDLTGLAAADALRRRFDPAQAAAALTLVELRRKAVAKFGERARRLYFTPDGLQQATRSSVAAWRAARYVAAGVREVVDVGCGIGADLLAFADAGLDVTGVEADPATAVLAQANIGERGRVVCGLAQDEAESLLRTGVAVFVDPARRTARGRSWRLEDFSPSWDYACGLLAGRFGCLKAAPGLDHALIPDGCEALWVSESGDLVELSLWSDGPSVDAFPDGDVDEGRGRGQSTPGRPRAWSESVVEGAAGGAAAVGASVREREAPVGRPSAAILLPAADRLDVDPAARARVAPPGAWLLEPDPSVSRSGGVDTLAGRLDAWRLAPGIAYLSCDAPATTPFATAFEVVEAFAFDERVLRRWAREHDIGTLEIKTRGLGVDPAVLRKRLRLSGQRAATVVLTPTPHGALTLVVRRQA